jgi:hypothetical protein
MVLEGLIQGCVGIVRVNASIAQVLPAAVKQLLPADTVEA